jgi:hypothetical protein
MTEPPFVSLPASSSLSTIPLLALNILSTLFPLSFLLHQSMFSTLPNRDATLEILMTAWRQQAPEAHAAFEGRDRSSSVSSQPPPMNVNTDVGFDHGGSVTPVAGRDRSQSAATAPPAVGGGHAAPNNGGVAPTGAGGGAGGEDVAKTAQKIESHPATTADTPDFPELALDTKSALLPIPFLLAIFVQHRLIYLCSL